MPLFATPQPQVHMRRPTDQRKKWQTPKEHKLQENHCSAQAFRNSSCSGTEMHYSIVAFHIAGKAALRCWHESKDVCYSMEVLSLLEELFKTFQTGIPCFPAALK